MFVCVCLYGCVCVWEGVVGGCVVLSMLIVSTVWVWVCVCVCRLSLMEIKSLEGSLYQIHVYTVPAIRSILPRPSL